MKQTHLDNLYPLLQSVWDYHQLKHNIQPADCMIIMGSHDVSAGWRAIDLYHQGIADLLIFTGGFGKITQALWQQSEAQVFADLAVQAGVPLKKMLLENHATNCGDNIRLSMDLLQLNKRSPQSVILVCKPYLERRAYATFKRQYPHIALSVTSHKVTLAEYLSLVPNVEQFIHLMVGDVQRILLYPAQGFQIAQAVPKSVHVAYEKLVSLGFNQQLIIQS